MKIEHKIFEAEVKAFDDENLILEHFISTEHKDRGGDIMRAKGMKIVGKPVVLMLHGRGPMSYEPIGKPLSLTVDEFKGEPGILAKTQFFNDEVGQRLYAKAKGGFLPNWSIGYSVDEAKDLLREGRYDGRDVTKWQLLEYSPVGVPMNPFAQTVKEFKEFLERTEKLEGPFQVPESHWFGVVDEKTCTGCGACEGKHGECSECKGPMTHFMKEGKHIGSTCEKCEPEKFAELTKTIAPPLPKCAACGDTKVVKGELDGKPFEEPCPKCCVAPPDEDGDFMMQIQALRGLVDSMREFLKDYPERLEALNKRVEQLEPLLKTLPPEPEGGEKGEEEPPDNPPEKKTPPRLVVVRDDPTPEAEKQAARARIIAIAREVINEEAKREIDRMKGRVP
jgi:hypothetical protein